MKTCVVGLGLIGGSIAKDLKASGFADFIVGVDSRDEHRAIALQLGFIDEESTLQKGIEAADLVVLAVPVDAAVSLLPKVLSKIKPNAVVTDVGSTKQSLCLAVSGHDNRKAFVASHPMAGTENSGPEAAFSGLFRGKTAVICDREASAARALQIVERLYAALQMRVVYMTAEEHDLHAAYVSHLSHITSFVLANTVLNQEKNGRIIFDLAGGGFESTVRLAKSSPAMWTPIFEQNSANVIEALQTYMAHLQIFYENLMNKTPGALRDLMEQANRIRPVLENISNQGNQVKKASSKA